MWKRLPYFKFQVSQVSACFYRTGLQFLLGAGSQEHFWQRNLGGNLWCARLMHLPKLS
jgi:hypothetical protein